MYVLELLRYLWNHRRPALVINAVLLLANLILFVVVQQWLAPRVFEREQFFVKRQAEVRQMMRQRGGMMDTPEQRFVTARKDLNDFNAAIPPYDDFTGLIEEMLVLSNKAGLDIRQMSYSQKQDDDLGHLLFNLSFAVSGDYREIKTFIHSLEESSRILVIEQIGLQGGADDTGGYKVSLRLQMSTLFQAKDEPS